MTDLERKAARLTPPYCHDCKQYAEFFPESGHIYNGSDFGPVWQCTRCLARCGCHKGTAKPFGTLANHETREARKRAHHLFDQLWRRPGQRFYGCRPEAYAWLGEAMGLSHFDCHIGMMTREQAEQVAELSQEILTANSLATDS